jgi:hypothetical protein
MTMSPVFLVLSLVTLVMGVACFLSPQAIVRLSGILDRSIVTMQHSVFQKRSVRYVMGLLLMLVSFGMFRLVYGG